MLKFCEYCRDMVEYHTEQKEMMEEIKGREVEYIGKIAYCKECNNEIFIADIRDYNLEMLDKAYREKEGLISISQIESILDRYNIGKRPLSILLGWGEQTVTRYLDGDIPTKQYSDSLKRLLNDLSYMEELLEVNGGKLNDVARRKSYKAVESIRSTNILNIDSENKIDNVVKYLLINSSDITPLALQKLLYYSQGFFKVFNGEYLFNDDCEAWIHGPVYRDIYQKYKKYGWTPILGNKKNLGDLNLTTLEKEILDNIIRNFGCYSGKVLEKMTHMEIPWRKTRIGLDDNEYSNRIIEKDLIKEYFTSIRDKYNMLNISDINDYSRDLFNKVAI